MSNGRKPRGRNRYRSEYLNSAAWHRRRDQWMDLEVSTAGVLRCAACRLQRVRRELELHHLDYTGVTRTGGRWVAAEHHADLIALDIDCHEALHQLLDSDRILRWHRSRRVATTQAIAALQRRWGLVRATVVNIEPR